MRLSTLLRVDSTIDDAGRSDLATRLARHWTSDASTVRFFRSSTNFLYSFRRGGRRAFLRFCHDAERSREEVDAQAQMLHLLHAAGILVATSIESRNDRPVETISTSSGIFHAVAMPALSGHGLELHELTRRQLRSWGRALAEVHEALAHIPPSLVLRHTWMDEMAAGLANLPDDEARVRREGAELLASLAALPRDRDSYGLSHLDFETDNIVWNEDGLGILDFDDCSPFWYAGDAVIALRDLFGAEFDVANPRAEVFFDGYRSVRRLPWELVAHGTVFLRVSRLLLHLRLRRAVDVEVDDAQPAWFQDLHARLVQRMTGYRSSLA